MKTIILIMIISFISLAQTDITVRGKLVTVKHADGTIIIDQYIDSARIETAQIIKVADNLSELLPEDVTPLPQIGGWCEKNKLYAYNEQVIICIQSHNRTIYPPEETPNLFNFYRSGTDLEWMANELVAVDDIRIYQGIKYQCLMGHTCIITWTPPATLGILWKLYVEAGACPQWVQPTGAHDAYNIGDCVTFNGNCYESTINANVWSPVVFPAGWQQVVCP